MTSIPLFKCSERGVDCEAGSPLAWTNIETENDEKWLKNIFGINKLPGVPSADGGDRFLTSRTRIDFAFVTLGLDLFTGDPGLKDRQIDGEGYYRINGDNDPDKYRAGVLYFKIGPLSLGWNSEGIRDFFQNDLIHKWQGVPLFRNLGTPNNFWFHFGVFY